MLSSQALHTVDSPTHRDRRVCALAEEFHDVLTTDQLVSCGHSRSSATRGRQRHSLHRIRNGIHSYGSPTLSTWGKARVGALHGGDGSVVTAWHALSLRRTVHFVPRVTTVLTPNKRTDLVTEQITVRVTLSSDVFDDEFSVIQHVPVATACRAVFDLCSTESPHRLVRLLREACHHQIASIEEFERLVARHPRSPSRRVALEVIRHYRRASQGSRSWSELEIFQRIEHCWRVPAQLNVPSGVWHKGKNIEPDVSWPGHPLVIELDGGDHADPSVHADDLDKDRALRAAGRIVLRIWNEDFARDPDGAIADIVAALEQHDPSRTP